MDNQQFHEAVQREFGPKMEHVTPANMRKFLSRMYAELTHDCEQHPFIIPQEDATNYEQVVAEFLIHALEMPPEQSVVLLWMFSCELFYARLGEQYEQNMRELLRFDISE